MSHGPLTPAIAGDIARELLTTPVRLDVAARAYLGVPFRHQGRNPDIGIDCIGLLVLCARDCGLPQASGDCTTYGKDPANGVLEGHLTALFGPARPPTDLQPGDIVAIDYKGAIRHVGVVAEYANGGLSLIHTNMKEGRVTEARIDAKWLGRIKAAWRVAA